jgi:hypothetical protein
MLKIWGGINNGLAVAVLGPLSMGDLTTATNLGPNSVRGGGALFLGLRLKVLILEQSSKFLRILLERGKTLSTYHSLGMLTFTVYVLHQEI